MIQILSKFISKSLFEATSAFLTELNIKFDRVTAEPIVFDELYDGPKPKYMTEALENIDSTYFIGIVNDLSLAGEKSQDTLENITKSIDDKYSGMFVFACDVKPEAKLTRTIVANLTRAFNRIAKANPVILIVRQNGMLTLATCERMNYSQEWRQGNGEKLGKVSILRNIECRNDDNHHTHPGHIQILKALGDKKHTNFESLYKHWMEVFSSELLTKKFYNELSDWYAWAVKVVRFPNKLDVEIDDDKYNHEAAIRLVTRLIFVWFLKQKHLIPDEFFDEDYIRENLIEGFNPNAKVDLFYKSNESKYYKAILQNLFFAILNNPITKEGKTELSERHFHSGRGDSDNNKLMCYKPMFKNPQLFIDLANKTVPFLNGGLFDCLDDKDNGNYVDGFSDREDVKKALVVPDYLFFGEEAGKDIDLSEWYGDEKKKKVSARGIIDILKRYNFTVEENTPFDQEVSLDPELLGKVFENLLASYNPETQTTARKQTGSFYTPREIVQYMVDESLVAHLKRTVGEELESEYRKLISYADEEILLDKEQKLQVMESIYHCKVLDPACGSGAFPVGMLQQMVHILSQLDPTNEQWKKMMLDEAVGESRMAFQAESKEEREERLRDLENSFDEKLNNPDYARKLHLIENCIYGVDIQPIAIQISKLRFFISLVVDQKNNNDPTKNFGIRPLPNLEAKFVAANSLIPLAKREANIGRTEEIIALETKLKEANHKIFSAKTVRTKRKWKERLLELRTEMAKKLADNGFLTTDAANQMTSWDMFDQNSAASFFDADWMFGIKDGFDVVIGNPPFIDAKKLKALASILKSYHIYAGTADLFTYFYEMGIKLLKDDGLITYITSNKWMRSDYGHNLRKYILEYNLIALLDFGTNRLFNATVDTNIMFVCKNKNKSQPIICSMQDCENLSSIYKYSVEHNVKVNLTEQIWLIKKGTKDIIKNKIEKTETRLIDLGVNIYRGILTGCNEAFHISTNKKNIFFDADRNNESIIHPLVRGVDTNKYICSNSNLWLINTHNGLKNKSINPINVVDYPVIKKHLDCYYDKLQKRGDKGCTPYNLRNCAYLLECYKEKIIWQAISKRSVYSYDPEGRYLCDVTTFFMTGSNLKYLLAILNSKLFAYALMNIYLEGDTFKSKNNIIQNFPVPKSNELVGVLSIEIDKIMAKKKENLSSEHEENNIDKLVYHLYNLTYDEVLIVDPETPITREEYESFEFTE